MSERRGKRVCAPDKRMNPAAPKCAPRVQDRCSGLLRSLYAGSGPAGGKPSYFLNFALEKPFPRDGPPCASPAPVGGGGAWDSSVFPAIRTEVIQHYRDVGMPQWRGGGALRHSPQECLIFSSGFLQSPKSQSSGINSHSCPVPTEPFFFTTRALERA